MTERPSQEWINLVRQLVHLRRAFFVIISRLPSPIRLVIAATWSQILCSEVAHSVFGAFRSWEAMSVCCGMSSSSRLYPRIWKRKGDQWWLRVTPWNIEEDSYSNSGTFVSVSSGRRFAKTFQNCPAHQELHAIRTWYNLLQHHLPLYSGTYHRNGMSSHLFSSLAISTLSLLSSIWTKAIGVVHDHNFFRYKSLNKSTIVKWAIIAHYNLHHSNLILTSHTYYAT